MAGMGVKIGVQELRSQMSACLANASKMLMEADSMEFTKACGVLWAWVVEETIDGFCGSYKDPGLSTPWELPSNYDEMAGEIAALVQKMGASATATVLQDAAAL